MTYEGVDAAGMEFIFLLVFWGGLALWIIGEIKERLMS